MDQLYPDNLGRILHQSLYERLIHFCEQYTPEFPAEPIVHNWLQRFFNGDPSIIILMHLDGYKIIAHALVELQNVAGVKIVMVHQLEYDQKKTEPFDLCMEQLDKIVESTGSHCSCLLTTKNVKVYERKYGYKVSRTLMVKYVGDNNDVDGK